MLYRIVVDTKKRPTYGNASMTGVCGRVVGRHRTLRAARQQAAGIRKSEIWWAVSGVRVGSWCLE
jgi:hypothetical protein